MKKQIRIAQGALGFLHSIMNSEPTKSLNESRKLRTAFACIQKPVEAYRGQIEAIQKKHRKPKKMKDPQGNEHEQLVIPPKVQEAYESELMTAGEKPVTVEFDVESFTVVKRIFEGVFDRPENKEAGLKGETQMKFIEEIASALDGAKKL